MATANGQAPAWLAPKRRPQTGRPTDSQSNRGHFLSVPAWCCPTLRGLTPIWEAGILWTFPLPRGSPRKNGFPSEESRSEAHPRIQCLIGLFFQWGPLPNWVPPDVPFARDLVAQETRPSAPQPPQALCATPYRAVRVAALPWVLPRQAEIRWSSTGSTAHAPRSSRVPLMRPLLIALGWCCGSSLWPVRPVLDASLMAFPALHLFAGECTLAV
jgi:hypothetical protein